MHSVDLSLSMGGSLLPIGAIYGATTGTTPVPGALFVGLLGLVLLAVRLDRAGVDVRPPTPSARTGKTFLLVSIVLMSAVAQPAAAATTEETSCNSLDLLVGTVSFGMLGTQCDYQSPTIQEWEEQNRIEDEQTLTDLKALAATQREQQDAHLDARRNYLLDSEDTVMQKAQSEIIEGLAAGHNKSQIRANATAAVADSYSRMQYNTGEAWNGTMASARYINEVAKNESGLSDDQVTMQGQDWTGNLTTENVSLVNGSKITLYRWQKPDASGGLTTGTIVKENGSIDTFEDGDLDEWTLDNSYSAHITQDSTEVYEGDYAMNVGDWDTTSDERAMRDFGAAQPDNATVYARFNYTEWEDDAAAEDAGFRLQAASSTLDVIEVNETGHLYNYEENYTVSVPENTYLKFTFEFNYANNSYNTTVENAETGAVILEKDGIRGWTTSADYSMQEFWAFGYHGGFVQVDNVDFGGTAEEINRIYVDGENETVTITNTQEYADLWTDLNSTSDRVEDNAAMLANTTYDAYMAGNVTVEELASNWGTTREYAMDYNETGYYTHALMAFQSAGIDGPDLNNTSYQSVRYYYNGSWHNGTGMILSASQPEYEPPYEVERVNGTWYTNYTYNASEMEGTQYFVTTDGELYYLEDRFELEAMYDRDGNEINSTEQESRDYQVTNSSDWVALSEELIALRKELEALEPTVSGGGGTPGLGDGVSSTTIAVGAVALAAVVALAAREDR